MTPRDFCYWLQGFFELREVKLEFNGDKPHVDERLSQLQVKKIKDHLDLVFQKETPTYPIGTMPYRPAPNPVDTPPQPPYTVTCTHAGDAAEVMPTCGAPIEEGVIFCAQETLKDFGINVPYNCGISIREEEVKLDEELKTNPPRGPIKRGGPFMGGDGGDPIQRWLNDDDAPVSC